MGQIRCRRIGPRRAGRIQQNRKSNIPSKRRASTTTDLAAGVPREFPDPLHPVASSCQPARDCAPAAASLHVLPRAARKDPKRPRLCGAKNLTECGSRILNPPITFRRNRAWLSPCPDPHAHRPVGRTHRPRLCQCGGSRLGGQNQSGAPAKSGFDAGYCLRAPTASPSGPRSHLGKTPGERRRPGLQPFGRNLAQALRLVSL